ncbi:MAG: hypothetical protein WCG01_03895 [bacterium]
MNFFKVFAFGVIMFSFVFILSGCGNNSATSTQDATVSQNKGSADKIVTNAKAPRPKTKQS